MCFLNFVSMKIGYFLVCYIIFFAHSLAYSQETVELGDDIVWETDFENATFPIKFLDATSKKQIYLTNQKDLGTFIMKGADYEGRLSIEKDGHSFIGYKLINSDSILYEITKFGNTVYKVYQPNEYHNMRTRTIGYYYEGIYSQKRYNISTFELEQIDTFYTNPQKDFRYISVLFSNNKKVSTIKRSGNKQYYYDAFDQLYREEEIDSNQIILDYNGFPFKR